MSVYAAKTGNEPYDTTQSHATQPSPPPSLHVKESNSNPPVDSSSTTGHHNKVNLWKKLKQKIKAAQKLESAAGTFVVQPTPEQRETSLRTIIDQFQTRVMEEVRPAIEQLGEDEQNEDPERPSKIIGHKWTTDKFTTHKHRVEQAGKCFQYGVPLFDLLIVLGLSGQIILFPVLVSFQPTDSWMYDIQILEEITLILYFALNCTLSARMVGLRSKELSDVEQHRRDWLVWDFFACLPINAIVGRDACFQSRYMCSVPIALNFLKFPVMLQRVRQSIYNNLESSNARKNFSTGYRAVRIVLIILSVMNVLSCLWFYIGTVDGYEHEHQDWFRHQNEDVLGQNYDSITRTGRWIQSWYYSMLILVGDSVVPRSQSQHVFCAFMMIFGTIATAILIGETANIINKMAAARSAFELKMESLDYMMGYLGLPRMLQYRVREYYEFLWDEHRCLDGNPTPFISELSPAIKSEVDLFLKRNLILQSDLFRDAPSEFIRDVSSQLTILFYLRGDYVVREKEKGDSMYFISRGTLRVCICKRYIKDMTQGDCFGEIAILRENSQRSASVYAHTHCTLYTLDRLGIHKLAALHPGVLERAIAMHYSHSSPGGQRTSLVFGRRASVDQFRMKTGQSAHNLLESKIITSPAGPAFIAIDEINATSPTTMAVITPSNTTTQTNASPIRRRQSQSMLGLEFRFQLVLNTLGLDGEAYQFALLGCENVGDVEHIKFEDLTNISKVQFNRMQTLCETKTRNDSDSDLE